MYKKMEFVRGFDTFSLKIYFQISKMPPRKPWQLVSYETTEPNKIKHSDYIKDKAEPVMACYNTFSNRNCQMCGGVVHTLVLRMWRCTLTRCKDSDEECTVVFKVRLFC